MWGKRAHRADAPAMDVGAAATRWQPGEKAKKLLFAGYNGTAQTPAPMCA